MCVKDYTRSQTELTHESHCNATWQNLAIHCMIIIVRTCICFYITAKNTITCNITPVIETGEYYRYEEMLSDYAPHDSSKLLWQLNKWLVQTLVCVASGVACEGHDGRLWNWKTANRCTRSGIYTCRQLSFCFVMELWGGLWMVITCI